MREGYRKTHQAMAAGGARSIKRKTSSVQNLKVMMDQRKELSSRDSEDTPRHKALTALHLHTRAIEQGKETTLVR